MIFNQFEEFGNYLWHYEVTGKAMAEVLQAELGPRDSYRGVTLTTGSAGTIACGDFLKQRFPVSKIAAGEAWQCPTLLENGFGAHRIEGIGDKHVPWIHNVKNTDLVVAIDDQAVTEQRVPVNPWDAVTWLPGRAGGLVGGWTCWDLGYRQCAVGHQMAKYYELGANDLVITVSPTR
jgi:hypothetical protein